MLRRWRPDVKIWRAVGILGVFVLLWAGYVGLGRPVTLVINNQSYPIRVHRLTVAGVLAEMGLALTPQDIVKPPPETRLSAGDSITVQLARPVIVEANGRSWQILTHDHTIADVLAEAGITLNPRDEILVNGGPMVGNTAAPGGTLPPPVPAVSNPAAGVLAQLLAGHTPQGAVTTARPEAVQLIVRRAVPVTINDGQLRTTFYTTQPNVGQALLEQGIVVFLADKVTPPLSASLLPGMRIYLERSIPVDVTVDGRLVKTRTRHNTVSQILAQEGVALMGQDFTRPRLSQALTAGQLIEVVRVYEAIEIEQELIPFEAKWIPDPEMNLDSQEVRQAGTTGSIKKLTRVRYENNQEVWRNMVDEWLDREPEDRVIAYGTHITIHTLETENGPIEYWRKISMLSTGYTAATSGKSRDHPRYGITRSGLPAGFGVVAVDPKVIPLMTNLYVPGYGPALAGDTGGKILGRHIDLGFDEGQPITNSYGWRDVYVLTPIPPPHQIRYVLPNWPQRP